MGLLELKFTDGSNGMFRGRLPFTVVTTMGVVLLMPLLAPAGVIHGFIKHYAISPVNNNQYGNWTLAVDDSGTGSVKDEGDGRITLQLDQRGLLGFRIAIPANGVLKFSQYAIGEGTVIFEYYYDGSSFEIDATRPQEVQVERDKVFGFELSSDTDFSTVTISDFSAPVPEPSTMALLGVGLAGLGVRQMLRRRKARRAVP